MKRGVEITSFRGVETTNVTSKATKDFNLIRRWLLFFIFFLTASICNFILIYYSFFKSPSEFIIYIYLVKNITLMLDVAGIVFIIGAFVIGNKNGH